MVSFFLIVCVYFVCSHCTFFTYSHYTFFTHKTFFRSFPDGEPTPDPALLVGVPEPIVWEVRVSIVHLYEFVCSI